MTRVIVTRKGNHNSEQTLLTVALATKHNFELVEHRDWNALGLQADIYEPKKFLWPWSRAVDSFIQEILESVPGIHSAHEEHIFTIPEPVKAKVSPTLNVTLNDTMQAVGAPAVWADPTFDGGTHIIIGSCDTGVDRSANMEFCFEDQPADGQQHTSRILGHVDYAGGLPYHAHGTWTTKFAARSPNIDGTWKGLAYKAKIYYAQVLNIQGQGTTVQVVDGLNYLVLMKCHVINMSLGGPHDATMDAAVEAAWNAGVAVCAAEGNGGRYPPACDGTINSPGDADNAIAVGACCIPSQGNGQAQVQTW